MIKILITNSKPFHYEIVESIIVKYYQIFNFRNNNILFYLDFIIDKYFTEYKTEQFFSYITQKYKNVLIEKTDYFDYSIECTIYDINYDSIDKNSSKNFYISHEITTRLQQLNNVYFLTPLANIRYFKANILPFANTKIKRDVPIYIIQGYLLRKKRNYDLLEKILENTYEYDFIFKIVGFCMGNVSKQFNIRKYINKIIFKKNLKFLDYHKEFLDCYAILPLISKEKQPSYYKNKLTSSINYASGYNLKCIIDKDLQDIYNLSNVEVYHNENDIVNTFKKTLYDFYN